ncbi:mitochondrial ATPase inhibitor [Aspergillus terreus]|uniref:ATPase inhibitor, mitochondrial n=1 Tax=Aspergillus terreus TaxID=33178 RepID=A0A5M3ZFW4_ASPTE|nr:hypothetical protein ATETN484_0014007000 [Aspergillus terreus]GFF20736.1 mitochondrial ATPase inhibitor [Aspergillus terreus]
MLRQSIIRPLSTANRAVVSRSFSSFAPRMSEGDTGAPRSGGSAQGYVSPISPARLSPFLMVSIAANVHRIRRDAFTRREAAQENLYIHEKEMEKLEALRKKVNEQQKHLNELDQHLKDLQKEQGGEKN